ncbi:MAG: CsbD family protein [Rubrivivax sp.]|nr:CsbD family protein [Rubrivivax sp.]
MNSNQIKGAAKDTAGAVRRKVGEAVGSTEQQLKGARDQAEGKVQKAAGNVQERAEDKLDDVARKTP